MKFRVLMFVFIGAFWGCGKSQSSNNDAPPGESESYNLNGKPAGEYYKQFLYKKEPNIQFPYRYLSSDLEIFREEGTRTRYFSVLLFLNEDQTYVVRYEELFAKATSNGLQIEGSDFKTEIRGTWKVDKTNLIVSNFGTGASLVYNDANAVALRIERNIHTEGMRNRMAILKYGRSNTGL